MTEGFDFSAYEPTRRTARFYVPIRGALVPSESNPEELVEGQPWLEVVYAGEGNKAYMNAVARATVKAVRGKRPQANAARVLKVAEENVAQDRELYPLHVIVGWGAMPGPNREPVEFTKERAIDFCAKIPAWIFLRLKAFVSNPQNFIDDEDSEPVEQEDVARIAGN